MTSERLLKLFQQHTLRTNSPEEEEELMLHIAGTDAEKQLLTPLNELVLSAGEDRDLKKETADVMLRSIFDKENGVSVHPAAPIHRIHFLKTAWFRYAAIILLFAGAGIYLYLRQQTPTQIVSFNPTPLKTDVLPGKDGAILTLADGSTVMLDSAGNGLIARQNGSRIVLNNGQLTYAPSGLLATDADYNTMSTPKGRQFRVILPDGTKVWLNAASSLRYPTAFKGASRKVEVSGEAYFEVAKNTKQPFMVKVNDAMTIEVLGTHFNINAYPDESAIKTTLLEGSVRVNAYKKQQLLVPGQQAKVAGTGTITLEKNADLDKVMAWKNGMFNFEGARLKEVMRQLSRWYDLEIVYEKGVPDIQFFGEMSRNMSLVGLLRTLEDTGVHFKVEEGRRLIVTP